MERETYRGIQLNPTALDKFKDTIEILYQKDIKVVLAHIPVIDFLNDINRSRYNDVIKLFYDIEQRYNNVVFLNYNSEYESQHDLFFDPRHLNHKGKQLITSRLSDDVKNIMNNRRLQSVPNSRREEAR
jgi:lysophospholipase L1-like esterase